jgi:Tfp pilus assembly protein PilP
VPTGALASELGLDDRAERNNNGGSNSHDVEVANIIVNSEVEEVEVVVNNPRALEPLEYFKKEELQYTGRLTNKYGKPIALISGPDGLMYKAGVGDRVGRIQAQVAEINNNNIEIRTGSQKDVIPLTKMKR